LPAHMTTEKPDGELPQLDQDGAGSLEGALTEAVSPTEGEREAGSGAEGRRVPGADGTPGSKLRPTGSVGNRAGAASIPAGSRQPGRNDPARSPRVAPEPAGDGNRDPARGDAERAREIEIPHPSESKTK
jgi:hypothetical protein